MLRRVITVHLVDERTPAIVRLQRELSAGNERLLAARKGPPLCRPERRLIGAQRPCRRERPVWIVDLPLIAEDLAAVPDPQQMVQLLRSFVQRIKRTDVCGE
jgi:hypothetical protein